jgi:hypothetical protein
MRICEEVWESSLTNPEQSVMKGIAQKRDRVAAIVYERRMDERSTMTKALVKTSYPGLVRADLAAPTKQYDLSTLVALINANIKPPTPVGEGDVYIRAMYIVSDAINAFGGRFPACMICT